MHILHQQTRHSNVFTVHMVNEKEDSSSTFPFFIVTHMDRAVFNIQQYCKCNKNPCINVHRTSQYF